jgi:hypothetical protein
MTRMKINIIYIKIVDLKVISNFVVEKLSVWNSLESQNIILSSQILKFEI